MGGRVADTTVESLRGWVLWGWGGACRCQALGVGSTGVRGLPGRGFEVTQALVRKIWELRCGCVKGMV